MITFKKRKFSYCQNLSQIEIFVSKAVKYVLLLFTEWSEPNNIQVVHSIEAIQWERWLGCQNCKLMTIFLLSKMEE